MEKILTLALATASDLYRRKVVWVLLGLVLLLSMGLMAFAGNLAAALEQEGAEELRWIFARRYVVSAFRGFEFFGWLSSLLVFGSLLPRDRESGLMGWYLVQPLSRLDYIVGKSIGGAIIMGIYLLVSQSVLWFFSVRIGGELDPALRQGSILLGFRLLLVGQVAVLMTVRWRALFAIPGAWFLFHLPMWMRGFTELYPDDLSWLEVVLWFVPAWDVFMAGRGLARHELLVATDFWTVIAYAAGWSVVLAGLAGWRLSYGDVES